MKRLVVVAALLLALAAVARYELDQRARAAGAQFLAAFDVAARRPDDAATLPLVPSADLGAEVIADIALRDTFGTVRLADASPDLHAAFGGIRPKTAR